MKLVLVALKCDLREAEERAAQDEPDVVQPPSRFIDYQAGLDVAQRIKALRYLGEWDLKGGGCGAEWG